MTLKYRSEEAAAARAPYIVEYYYKIRWGSVDEFLALFRKNHLPVLEKQLETGRILEIRSEQPRFHGPEEGRWDLRVTLVFPDVVAAHDKSHEPAVIRALYPDLETFEREEQRRFALMLAHWDLPIVAADLSGH